MSVQPSRVADRDVFFADLRDPDTFLGGLVLTPGITNANFFTMLEIAVEIAGSYSVQNMKGELLSRDSNPLHPGVYFIRADHPVTLTQERALVRSRSASTTGPRVSEFSAEVRKRDGGCVITKQKNPRVHLNEWKGYQAAHVFPLAHLSAWEAGDFDRHITFPPTTGGTINSVQNGLLLRSDIHEDFDAYYFSINPDASSALSTFRNV